jgi:hypothetical protein
MEAVGADIKIINEKGMFETRYTWNISVLGIVQWGATIAMIILMAFNRADIADLHKQIHGDDDSKPHFEELRKGMVKIRADLEAVQAVDADGQNVYGLKNVMLHTHNELHTVEQHLQGVHALLSQLDDAAEEQKVDLQGVHALLSHLDDAAEEQKVDLAAFIEHHADDVECADCRDNIYSFLVGLGSQFEDGGYNNCGEHYCVEKDTPVVVNSNACVGEPKDATCTLTANASLPCDDASFVAAKFDALDVNYTGAAVDCNFTTCTHTPATVCADLTPTAPFDAATGEGVCASTCVATGHVVYDTAQCETGFNDTANTGCHSNCNAYTGVAPCFNSTLGTAAEQFEAYYVNGCTSAGETFQFFNEDHYRKHSVCGLYSGLTSGEMSNRLEVARLYSNNGLNGYIPHPDDENEKDILVGPRAACEFLNFCS